MKHLFLSQRLFLLLGGLIGLFLLAYLLPVLLDLGRMGVMVLGAAMVLDAGLLFQRNAGIALQRELPERLSNGDPNEVRLRLRSRYGFPVKLTVTDEVPEQFQWRDMRMALQLPKHGSEQRSYWLRPVTRGEYAFGQVQVLLRSPLGLLVRRFQLGEAVTLPCYPSFLQMQKYQLMAISNRLSELGVKPIRRLGHSSEFEQIKEYVRGDDYRTINWKATARSRRLMVNQFVDERSQHVYCLIDKSRNMKMPFEGMSLLDYAINASLVLANIAIHRHDRAGLLTFSSQIDQFLPASHRPKQIRDFQELLYRQETLFQEPSYERLYAYVKHRIAQRSLLILFTNFESQQGMQRQLPYLQRLARQHLLLVVMFENTELDDLLASRPENTEEIYVKAIGEQLHFDKRLIVRELEQHGIIAILTKPQHLTVSTINRYLEIKAKGML